MRIAVEGCCHGRLDDIYGTVRLLEQREGYKIDLVLICGDFQSLRNVADIEMMAVPVKYRELGTFWKYYSGRVKAPYPTIFIGGNHEASNYLWELYHGGWVCENIYYLGHAGVINFGGLRIGGISGISKSKYQQGHFEKPPYNDSQLRSAYYVREYDVKKLLSVSEPMDIFLSHDWPRGVERFGNLGDLMRWKTFFHSEILTNSLGSHPNELLLSKLQPEYWFSAHLHVRYAALVNHDMYKDGICPPEAQAIMDRFANPTPQIANPEAIDVDLDADLEDNNDTNTLTEENTAAAAAATTTTTSSEKTKFTKFLSLDKCVARKQFLQVLEIPSANDETGDYDFYYDMEWLAITRATQPYLSTSYNAIPLPPEEELKATVQKERAYLQEKVQANALDLKIPHNFEPSAPAHDPSVRLDRQTILEYQQPFVNSQTVQFCRDIGIEDKVNQTGDSSRCTAPTSQPEQSSKRIKLESEIIIDDDDLL